MSLNPIMPLNHVTANHLLTFLGGVDAVNFIEAMNISEALSSLALTSDHAFRESMKRFCGHKRILIRREFFSRYEDSYDIDEKKLILVSKRYSTVAQPELRLYVHPCFGVDAFRQLVRFYNTPLFKCFTRLLSYNTIQYCADFGLVNYISFYQTISSGRMLNEHEKKLFIHNKYFDTLENQKRQTLLTFVNTIDEFRHNLASRFLSNTWLPAIDFAKFIIVGGCVLNALCTLPFPDTNEDINLIYFSGDWTDFEQTVSSTVAKLKEINQNRFTTDIEVKKIFGTFSYDLILPHGIKLNLKFNPANNSSYPISHVLYEFDIDICQVAYTGQDLVSTFSFIEAITTKTFLVYTLHGDISKNLCIRIQKFCNRGFTFLVPSNFDGDFDELISQEYLPSYRVQQFYYINDDGESQLATKEVYLTHEPNVDTFDVQDQFLSTVCPQLLEYE